MEIKAHIMRLRQTIAESVTSEKIEEVIRQATLQSNSMEPDLLWRSLVISGVDIGIEQTQGYFLDMLQSNVKLLRDQISHINKGIVSVTDTEATAILLEIQANFKAMLHHRVSVITGMHVERASETYDIPGEYITREAEPCTLPNSQLEKVGFLAYRKAPHYFAGWQQTMSRGKISGMLCKCANCMMKSIPDGGISEVDVLDQVLQTHGSMSKAFTVFGEFLICEVRDAIAREMEGVSYHHDHDHENSQEAAETLMDALRKIKKT